MTLLVCSRKPERHGYWSSAWVDHANAGPVTDEFGDLIVDGAGAPVRELVGRGLRATCAICGAGNRAAG